MEKLRPFAIIWVPIRKSASPRRETAQQLHVAAPEVVSVHADDARRRKRRAELLLERLRPETGLRYGLPHAGHSSGALTE